MKSPCRECQKPRDDKRCFQKCKPMIKYREWLDRQDNILQAVDCNSDYRLLPQ